MGQSEAKDHFWILYSLVNLSLEDIATRTSTCPLAEKELGKLRYQRLNSSADTESMESLGDQKENKKRTQSFVSVNCLHIVDMYHANNVLMRRAISFYNPNY